MKGFACFAQNLLACIKEIHRLLPSVFYGIDTLILL
jgi:hypothetical protein